MKTTLLAAALVLPLALSSGATWAAERTVTLDIQNMTCALCPITVSTAIKGVDGVRTVNVNFEAKTATVVFDDAVSNVDTVAQASTNAGYPASH